MVVTLSLNEYLYTYMDINHMSWYSGYASLAALIQGGEYENIYVYHSDGFVRYFFDRLQRGLITPEEFMQLGDIGSPYNPYEYSRLPRVDILFRVLQVYTGDTPSALSQADKDDLLPSNSTETQSIVALTQLSYSFALAHYSKKVLDSYIDNYSMKLVVLGEIVSAPWQSDTSVSSDASSSGNVFDYVASM